MSIVPAVENNVIELRKFIDWDKFKNVFYNNFYLEKYKIVIKMPLKKLIKLMESWGSDMNHPNQYWYPDQVASAHIYLDNGKQFHVRVYKHEKGLMLQGHLEWHGITHPIRHTMYANLDYEKGYRMLKKLLEKTDVKIIIDKGKDKYDKKSKSKKK